MLNHLHFIGQVPDMISVIRDMKKFLSKELQKNIIATEPEILKLFTQEDSSFTFWYGKNHPKLISSDEMLNQKYDYIQYNPVRKEDVSCPEEWRWSSASKTPSRIMISDL